MPNWLKALIAGACIVVIGAGGVFSFQAYEAYRQRQEASAYQAACLNTAFDLAKYIKTQSALDETAAAMTHKVRGCIATLRDTDFAESAESIVRGSGYTLKGDPYLLPLAD